MKSIIKRHKTESAVLSAFGLLMLIFIISSPGVFLSSRVYTAVFTTMPITIMLAVAAVFMVSSGEIDLSFPSVVGLSAWTFAATVHNLGNPWLGLLFAVLIGAMAGLGNGLLVTKLGLSSLVSTLGMNFLLRGLIMIGTQGFNIPLTALRGTPFHNVLVGRIGTFPVQMLWSLLFAFIAWALFTRHRFGGHVCFVGDNLLSSREMGISVDRVKILTFMFVGFTAGLAAVFSSMVNLIFWPTAGEGYLLVILAAVFLGGTPTWGGIGTIFGAIIGAFILSFVETGIIASGLTGFYTQFFYGLILILSLISHRFTGVKKK